jgi:hypothetical protein
MPTVSINVVILKSLFSPLLQETPASGIGHIVYEPAPPEMYDPDEDILDNLDNTQLWWGHPHYS